MARLSDLVAAGIVPVWSGTGLIVPLTAETVQGSGAGGPVFLEESPRSGLSRVFREALAGSGSDVARPARRPGRPAYGRGGIGGVRRKKGEMR